MRKNKSNPYLLDKRLADVLAAITTLANYRYYKLSFEKCAERIENNPERAEHWGEVFKDHPEFFRLSEIDEGENKVDAASLVWRRQKLKRYDVKTGKTLGRKEYDELTDEEKSKISRSPLTTEETTALLEIALNLHERAIEDKSAKLWWVPIFTVVVSFIATLVAVWLGAILR